jgi:hypothetical protein
MSASFVVIVPLSLLAIVMMACFIGCGLSTTGTKQVTDWFQYQATVTGTSGLVAFWPLNDTSGTTAADIGPNHFNGNYTTGPNVPTYNAVQQSDAAPGTFTLNAPNIVAGDSVNNDQTTPSPCAYFDGGYVGVPWQAALGPPLPQPMQPPLQFTLEAWVMPDWNDPQNQSYRVVVGSDAPSAFQGFALYASPDNLWAAVVGTGSQNLVATTGNNQTIVQGSLYFLVMTCDGSTLTLWVNPADTSQPPDGQATASGFVPIASPFPLYIGIGHPDLPTPLLPFKGWIQDVAFYNVVLDGNTIETHYLNGSGMQE